eukprot:7059725-Alexandrium_andersonii.AAC.1
MPVSGAIHLKLHPAMRKPQTRLRHSKLELRGPRKRLKLGPRSSRRVRSAPLFVEIPNPPSSARIEG